MPRELLLEEIFEELHRVNPKNTVALAKLGEIAYGFGDRKNAVAYFSELRELDPSKITPEIEDLLLESSSNNH